MINKDNPKGKEQVCKTKFWVQRFLSQIVMGNLEFASAKEFR